MKGYIFLDVGGTQVKSAAYSEAGERLCPIESVPALAGEDRDTILSNFLSVIGRRKECLLSAGLSPDVIGFAFPGPFDYPEGISRIRGLDKYDSIYGVPLREALLRFPGQQAVTPDTRMFFLHDIASFALGEAYRSLSGQTQRIFCLCIGTGAGSAFLEKGKLLTRDPRVPENGWIYSFPLRGKTIDDWVSARGLAKLAGDAGFPAGTAGKDLYRMARDGNEAARAVWRQFGILIAEAAAPFIRSFRPQMLLFGGQIAGAIDYFGPAVRNAYPGLSIRSVPDTTESIFRGLRAALADQEG